MATHIFTYAYNLKTKENQIRSKHYGNQIRKILCTKHLCKLGTIVAVIACIPLVIGIYFTGVAILNILSLPLDDYGDEFIPQIVPSLRYFGISLAIFYIAGSLKVIAELIQFFLAIEENTYQSAQNTSSNQIPSAN